MKHGRVFRGPSPARLAGRGRRTVPCAAFTLIELLVVISIISLLVSIMTPSLSTARELAKKTRTLANLHTVGVAVHMYAIDSGSYCMPLTPPSDTGTSSLFDKSSTWNGRVGLGLLITKYLPQGDIFYQSFNTAVTDDDYRAKFTTGASTLPGEWKIQCQFFYSQAGYGRSASIDSNEAKVIVMPYQGLDANNQPVYNHRGDGMHVLRANGTPSWIQFTPTMGLAQFNTIMDPATAFANVDLLTQQ
jgi:prepilin-type N-terminal cleavage/methylation domain-containing protein